MGGGTGTEGDSHPPQVGHVAAESKENMNKNDEDPKPDSKPRHIELVTDNSKENGENGEDGIDTKPSPALTNGKGWDGKLRIPGRASLANPEALSDPEYSDEDNVVDGEKIEADEGSSPPHLPRQPHLHPVAPVCEVAIPTAAADM